MTQAKLGRIACHLEAIAIEDADRREALKEQHAGLLEKPNRPRFIEQVLARPDDEK